MSTRPDRSLAGTAALVVLAGLLAGCGASERSGCPDTAVAGLAVAIGARANSPAPVLPSSLDEALDQVMDAEQGFTAIRVDGDPTIACGMRFNQEAQSTNGKAAERRAYQAFVHAALADVRSVQPEADPLRALSYAATVGPPGGTVLLVDSGLQTVAPLNFAENPALLDADPGAVVADLRQRDLLPDLTDRRVVLAGIGYTAAPQPDLDDARRRRLVALWTQIAEASGAVEVTVAEEANTKVAATEEPAVASVDVGAVATLPPTCDLDLILWDDGAVGFAPESAELADLAAARSTLAQVAARFTEHPSATVELVGTVAHYGSRSATGTGLSQQRADRVKAILVDLGVAAGRIRATGAGWGPYPTPDAPPDPRSDQLNRRVTLTVSC
ncbi:OmpA family protein [Solwaraspora sp. WMMB335]|uniref:OmpA family protein n=1 Tax=Solwaraspora sp. WMMB335 TaxID=3404118 RepID=UPI003B9256E7